MFLSCHILIWANLCFYLIATFMQIFQCIPREMIWNKFVKDGHCLPIAPTTLSTGVYNVGSDLIILILPLYTIWKLQMPLKSKIAVSAVFATGSTCVEPLLFSLPSRMLSNPYNHSAFVACVLRLYYNIKLTEFAYVNEAPGILQVAIWTIAELAIGITWSCLPMVKKFFLTIRTKMASKSSATPFQQRTPQDTTGNSTGPKQPRAFLLRQMSDTRKSSLTFHGDEVSIKSASEAIPIPFTTLGSHSTDEEKGCNWENRMSDGVHAK